MAVETPREPAAALAGLDQLELAPPQQARRHVLAKFWVAAWPKLLALVLALAIWQLVYLSGFKSGILPGPAATLPDLWHQLHTAQLWQALGTTLRRAVIGFALALVIGTVVGALVSRIRPLRAAVGSLITALQTLPSIVWVPFAIILFGATTQAILFVVVMTAAPAIANGLIAGADYLPPLLLRAGRTMGLRRLSLYRHVIMRCHPARVRGRAQAGLGVRLARADRGRGRGHHPRPALARRAAEQRPGSGSHGLGDLDHYRDPGHRHRRGPAVQSGQRADPAPLGRRGLVWRLTPGDPRRPGRRGSPGQVLPARPGFPGSGPAGSSVAAGAATSRSAPV